MHQNFWGPPPNLGCKKKHKILWLAHSAPHISGTKRGIDKQKCLYQSTMCPLQVDQLSMTFDPETAEIRLLLLTHPSAAITLQPSKLWHLELTPDMFSADKTASKVCNTRLSHWYPTDEHLLMIRLHTISLSLKLNISLKSWLLYYHYISAINNYAAWSIASQSSDNLLHDSNFNIATVKSDCSNLDIHCPHTPIGKVWIYCLLFVCLFVQCYRFLRRR